MDNLSCAYFSISIAMMIKATPPYIAAAHKGFHNRPKPENLAEAGSPFIQKKKPAFINKLRVAAIIK